MLRRVSVAAVLAFACALTAATAAQATVLDHEDWEVFITGKQATTWSFAAEQPEECITYYGTPSQVANGNGRVAMVFTTPAKQPLSAETAFFNGRMRFTWESLGDHRIPAAWSKRGVFSTSTGKPCGSRPDDPVPLPQFADASGCGRQKGELNVYASWKDGVLIVQGAVEGVRGAESCPGVFEQAMHVDPENDRCTPGSWIDGTDGTYLQELHTPLPRRKFSAGRAFTVKAQHEYDCDFPATIWPGNPVLKADLVTSYEVTFKPRRY
ncbi:MAG: hypothetical protein JST31_07700 [Actinobacteria bacterium]|nr:hypothetical protein [Actinomycetota bacterium]